jgi:acetolactate synthase-1/2/3 large subunit
VYQEVDDVPAFETVTKMNTTIDAVERIPDMVRQAFRVATTGAPGPVHIQFAGNEGQIDAEEAEMDVHCEEQYTRVPPFRPAAPDEILIRALDLMVAAERPVIVAGGGVRASGASQELVHLAERLGIPVATSLNGKDVIPGIHPLSVGVVGTYSRGSANQVVLDSDLVFFVGTETGGMTTHFWKVPPIGTRAIQLDLEPEALGRNYPPEVAINADARTALTRMLELAGDPRAPTAWARTAAGHVADWRLEYAPLLESDEMPMRPERLCAELTDLVPDDGIVVVDTGHAGMWMGGMFDLRRTTQSYIRSAGHLGWAFPASLGAKCAQPDRPVVCFTGDSGFWYHVAEIETAVRWGINSITVVNNNHSGNQSKRGFDRVYGGKQSEKAREMWVFTEVDFARLAEEIGAVGIRVEKPADLASAFDRALSADRPVVLDVVTDIDALAPPAVE